MNFGAKCQWFSLGMLFMSIWVAAMDTLNHFDYHSIGRYLFFALGILIGLLVGQNEKKRNKSD